MGKKGLTWTWADVCKVRLYERTQCKECTARVCARVCARWETRAPSSGVRCNGVTLSHTTAHTHTHTLYTGLLFALILFPDTQHTHYGTAQARTRAPAAAAHQCCEGLGGHGRGALGSAALPQLQVCQGAQGGDAGPGAAADLWEGEGGRKGVGKNQHKSNQNQPKTSGGGSRS